MSHKSRSGELEDKFPQNAALHAVMIEFTDCFNRGHYFEAHEVLEKLWLPQRQGPDGAFFKGLIQLAGAFVHVQKGRSGPAIALLKLADRNVAEYPDGHFGVPVAMVRGMISEWMARLAATSPSAAAGLGNFAPVLKLVDRA